MLRAEITNFESVKHAVVEIDGFTTVQGPNYSGKSATMRAINAALTNPAGTEFISWGESFCEVHLWAEGLDLLWHKEEGNNFYVINGESYKKIGRDEPPAELGNLGYGTVKINGQRHNLHYADQFSPLFLVDDQNTKTADLMASVYGLDRLYKAAELCSKDQKSSEALLKVRKRDLDDVESDLKKFDGLDDVLEQGARLKEASSRISGLEEELTKAGRWSLSMGELASFCNRLKPAHAVVLPDSGSISTDTGKVLEATGLFSRMEAIAVDVRRLSPVHDMTLPDQVALSSSVAQYHTACDLLVRMERAEEEMTRLAEYKDVTVADGTSTAGMEAGIGSLSFLRKAATDIIGISEEMKSLSAGVSECTTELTAVETERAAFGVCPLCGGELHS